MNSYLSSILDIIIESWPIVILPWLLGTTWAAVFDWILALLPC